MTALDDDPIILIDPSTVSPRRVGLKWGFILGAGMIFASLIAYVSGNMEPAQSSESNSVASFIVKFAITILVAVIVKAIQEHKTELGGYIRGGRSILVGVWIGLGLAFVNIVWGLLFSYVIDPSFNEEVINSMVVNLENEGMSDSLIESTTSWIKMTASPIGVIISNLLIYVTAAVILSIIPALIMKKKPEGMF